MAIEEIKRRDFTSPDHLAVEEQAIASVHTDPEKHIKEYIQDTAQELEREQQALLETTTQLATSLIKRL